MSLTPPPTNQPIAGGSRVDPYWERWLGTLVRAVNSAGSSTPAPAPEPVSFVIDSSGSVASDGSVESGAFSVSLVNDKDNPPPNSFYGADTTGTKGFVPVYDALQEGTGIALLDSGYVIVDTVGTPDDLPLTGNAGEAVRVTESEPGLYAWDGAAFTLDPAATGIVAVGLDANLADLSDVTSDTPSNGDVLVYNATTGTWAPGAQSGSGAMVLVDSATVAGSAATSLSLTGLDLAADGRYVMQFSFKNATASAANLSLVYNGDTTAANYYVNALTSGTSGSPTASVGANGRFCGLNASLYVDGETVIQARHDGAPLAVSRSRRTRTSGSYIELMQDFSTIWNNTANVTTLDVVSDVANSLAVGSLIKLWKIA